MIPAQPNLPEVMRRLDMQGAVSLPGDFSRPTQGWKLWLMVMGCFSCLLGVLGVVAIVVSLLLRDVGVWSILIVPGLFFAPFGFLCAIVFFVVLFMWRGRTSSDLEPVRITTQTVDVRGLGTLPWRFFAPPERTNVYVKNDIGGKCTVMRLTPEGQTFVNAQPGSWRLRLGPKPLFSANNPFFLLPGIQGMSEDEVLQLFAFAHARFARFPQAPWPAQAPGPAHPPESPRAPGFPGAPEFPR